VQCQTLHEKTPKNKRTAVASRAAFLRAKNKVDQEEASRPRQQQPIRIQSHTFSKNKTKHKSKRNPARDAKQTAFPSPSNFFFPPFFQALVHA
jgi:hypothetical protein